MSCSQFPYKRDKIISELIDSLFILYYIIFSKFNNQISIHSNGIFLYFIQFSFIALISLRPPGNKLYMFPGPLTLSLNGPRL